MVRSLQLTALWQVIFARSLSENVALVQYRLTSKALRYAERKHELISTHVVLVHPEIHWNAGNTGRTCLAAGARLHLIEPLGFSLDEREVKRAGLDYWEHVDVHLWPNWEAFEKQLPDLGEPYFFSARATRALWDAPFNLEKSVVLVFGKESTGLSAELCERYRDRLWGIPMLSSVVRSLNLSTSVGVALYEVLRRRRMESDGFCR